MALLKPTSGQDHPGVIAFPPVIWLIGAGVSGFVHFMVPGRMMMGHDVSLRIGIALAGMALALMIWAITVMKMAGTNVHPRQPVLTITRNGPYRFTRNPMYLALCLLQAALGFFFNDWILLLFIMPLVLVLHYGVILREEKYLEAKFGDQYLALKRDVRRWV